MPEIKHAIPRRTFLRTSTLAGLGLATFPTVISSCVKGANDKINVGLIGTGEHCVLRNLKNMLEVDECRVVALCDVDARRLEVAAEMVKEKYQIRKVSTFSDFRELLLREDIDAIQISTPDHWHVYMAIAALKAGKHVICEKPTLTIEQGRILVEQVRKYGKVFQTSLEDRTLHSYHRMAELVRNGRIGELRNMRVGLPGKFSLRFDPSLETQPVPKYFDFDMWLGPAPEAPYSPGRCHWNFRWIEDYSGGNLTDWGAHLIDNAQWCNGSEKWGPVMVEGMGSRPSGIRNVFDQYKLKYTYENGVEMDVHSQSIELYCEGSDGWLHVDGWNGKLQASDEGILHSELGAGHIRLKTAENEQADFMAAIRSGEDPFHPVEDLHRTSSISHIGNIAMKLERKLEWDPAAESFVDDVAADALRTRPERDPWQVDKLL